MNRRAFLASTAALSLAPALARATSPALPVLRAQPASQQIVPAEYPATDIWTFNKTLPGETLRYTQGDTLRRRVINDLPQATSVHWHGIRIDNAMDGVPGLTQDAIEPGGQFDYSFKLPDAGTYWYHSHAQSVEQIERGLYGPLIIAEAETPEIDRELVLVLDDLRLTDDAQIAGGFANRHDRSHAGRLGNVVLTNGIMDLIEPVRRNERLRLRLINAANARVFQLGLLGMTGWTVALDGMPLETPEPLTDAFFLAPAQRADLIVDVSGAEGEEAHLVHVERDEQYSQVAFPISAQVSASTRPAPGPLPQNPVSPLSDLAGATTASLRMEGGAMRGLAEAVYNGQPTDMRTLAQANQFWALNGVVGRTDVPLADLSLGETLRLSMKNDTAFPHAMHLHGMHFREVMADGTLGPWRDTLLTFPGDTRDIAFVADNPGDWLMHCHMLSHHAAGMGTWIRVRA